MSMSGTIPDDIVQKYTLPSNDYDTAYQWFIAHGAHPSAIQGHPAYQEYQKYLENPTPSTPVVPDTSARDTAAGKAKTGIEKAFTDYGIKDLTPYSKNIEDKIAKSIAGIPTGTTDFDKYFADANLGSSLITELEGPYKKKALDLFDKDIQTDYFTDTSDDSYIDELLKADRVEADKFLKTMLDRGQILQPGYDAGILELDRLGGLGKTRLNEIGANLLNTGESNILTERTKKRGAYDALKLGGAYDVAADDAALDKMASDFLGTLGTGLKTGLGSASLFPTGGLGAIAGAAQGGQNTTFGSGATGGGTQTGTPAGQQPVDDDEEPTQQDILF